MIQVENLFKRYNGVTAIDDISFVVRKGEIFGLLGPNGAGKTTTLRVLSTILKPDRGQIRIGGHSVINEAQKVREIIGVCPQEIALYPELSARDNLIFFALMGGFKKSQAQKKSKEILTEIGLDNKADEKVSNLSGGMKRRLNLAASIIHQPLTLFMDEPTVGVDPRSRAAIFDILNRFKQKGITIVYTTHYMEEAERLCDRVAIMNNGKIIALESPETLKKKFNPEGQISFEEIFLELTR